MSAPPIGSVMVSPSTSASTKNVGDHRRSGVHVRGHQPAQDQRRPQQQQVEQLLAAEADAARDQALQLAEGDGAAAEGDRADDAAGDRERRSSA